MCITLVVEIDRLELLKSLVVSFQRRGCHSNGTLQSLEKVIERHERWLTFREGNPTSREELTL